MASLCGQPAWMPLNAAAGWGWHVLIERESALRIQVVVDNLHQHFQFKFSLFNRLERDMMGA